MKYYAIADIAGEFDALMRLVARFDKKSKIILLGDLVDRGMRSKEVISWAIQNQQTVIPIMGNHEHMMLDWLEKTGKYADQIWLKNGGLETLFSYFGNLIDWQEIVYDKYHTDIIVKNSDELRNLFPKKHIDFLKTLKTHVQVENNGTTYTMTHAPIFFGELENAVLRIDSKQQVGIHSEMNFSCIWYRGNPKYVEKNIQIFGHNSHWGLKYFPDKESPYAICLDDSRKKVLTAIELGSLNIIQEPYEKNT